MAAPNPISLFFVPGDSIAIMDSARLTGLVGFRFYAQTGPGQKPSTDFFGSENQIDVRLAIPHVLAGPLTFAFGGDSWENFLPSIADSAEIGFNDLDAIRTAGRVDVEEIEYGLLEVQFRSTGSQTAITVTHPTLGALSRVTETRAGDGSTKEVQRIDLRLDRLATVATGSITAITGGAIAIAVTSDGATTNNQVETVTFADPVPNGGSMVFSNDGGTNWSPAIDLPATSHSVQLALDAIDPGRYRADVQADQWVLETVEPGALADLSINTDSAVFPAGFTAEIDFDAIRRQLERHHAGRDATILIELVSGADLSDSAAQRQTLLTLTTTLAIRGPSVAEPAALP